MNDARDTHEFGLREDTACHEDRSPARIVCRERVRMNKVRARRRRRALFGAALVVMGLMAGWRAFTPSDTDSLSEHLSARTRPSVSRAVALRQIPSQPQGPPTPVFATHQTMQLHLPVPLNSLTEIAFHQASNPLALPMESLLPDADPESANGKRGTGRISAREDDESDEPAVLEGKVIRMWRSNRRGNPDTAADVGALPGTPVFAPVSGTVIEVKPYDLYGKYADVEIHIRPEGWPEADLVMIHLTDPTVRAGDIVVGGLTRIAAVRLLSDRVHHQIADYTPDGGDHTHVQLNRMEELVATEPVDES